MPENNELAQMIMELTRAGYCCSQIVMKIMMENTSLDNEFLLNAMAGLCFGMQNQFTCGVLTAASCALACLADNREKGKTMVRELGLWFKENFGSIECKVLLQEAAGNSICPGLIEETIYKCFELLEEI